MKIRLFTFLLVMAAVFLTVSAVAAANPVCGNGVQEGNEQCDDGNHIITDTCDTFGEAPGATGTCKATFCGDGALQSPNGGGVNEKCDTAGKGYCSSNPDTACTLGTR